jgi:hypothetical protein
MTTNSLSVYLGEKVSGEQAVLNFAANHSNMDITIGKSTTSRRLGLMLIRFIVNPPWVFGPHAPGFQHIVPKFDFATLSTNAFVYQLLRPDNVCYHYHPTGIMDIRDVARIHLAALNPKTLDHPRRIATCAPHDGNFRDALKYLAKEHPELQSRLADPQTVPVWDAYKLPIDHEVLDREYGIRADSYIPWNKTIVDAIESLLFLEEQWIAQGFKVDDIPREPPM